MAIKHTFVSAIADGGDTSLVQPSNWNADHTIDAGTITLDAIGAAAADQAGIANADKNIRWNWAMTTDSEVAFEIGESAASTGGTSTTGVPNQVIAKFSTAAASTASPLSVYSRAAHVFSVSPSTAQILAAGGSAAAPTYAFSNTTNNGMWNASGSSLQLVVGGTAKLFVQTNDVEIGPAGSNTQPSLTNSAVGNTGLTWFGGSNTMSIVNATDGEWVRFITRAIQLNRSSADATAYAINARKSRGTVASPTVITTGDDLLTINALGYVGSTNTYQLAASIEFDSTGTISDSATGIGGIIRFNVATVGAEPVEVGNFTGNVLNLVQGLSTTLSPAVTTANVNTTAVGNVGAGEDDLMTYSLPANSFSAAGKGVHITAWGTTANNAETKTVKLYFGSTILTNALTASIAGVWRIEADVFSTGTDAQQYVSQLVTTGTAGVALNDVEQGTLTENDGAAITIKCTGDVGAPSTNDSIVQEGMIVKFHN